MKTVITLFIIILMSSLLTYSQISEDMWEVKLDLTRSVEPALAVNPLNGNILVAYMEYASLNPRVKYALCSQDGDIIASGIISNHASDPDVIFDQNGMRLYCLLIVKKINPFQSGGQQMAVTHLRIVLL